MKSLVFSFGVFLAVLLPGANAQKHPLLKSFGYPGDNLIEPECAPVRRCPLPCRLGKETTGCALCVCPPACKPCYSNCYYPSRPNECPQCAYPFYCELGNESVYPGLAFGRK